MSLTIELAPELENRLNDEARSQGIALTELVQKLLSEQLAQPSNLQERLRRERVMQELVAETESLGLYQ